ncbi:hypothetical protein NEOLEDRAFT_1135981 [Neolentinus lepideus HHB14362 ss-1]|uniref:N-acetyltransferase domain-containing protein n=1 Tax=Neolentinus lepideus HHB14362 ss-1 TaxID=1314782 RepID=A0A165RHQ1_9AGAM|nr:hypothetical protein NEOLEDRAFT_1135981 [Neolentinus lepideus HHB14362 ss-1]
MDTDFIVKHLHSPTDAQVDHMVALADRAYGQNHPSQKAMVGGDWSLHPILLRAMLRAGALEDVIYVVMNKHTEEIVTVSLWFPPGRQLFSTDDQKALGFNDFMTKISPEAKKWWSTTYVTLLRDFRRDIFSDEEGTRRWWCPWFTTDPNFQQRGFGTALITTIYNKAALHGGFLGLMTDREVNVPKYLAMGFGIRGRINADAPTGDFPVICLTREH